ncbi:hypothetical protein DFJ73DRAFT_807245 [Zopfochytrium polystomum]|nr:hypothetical protein DFJ73DRAFT_807245 [Zopfochytrium polystomum]
MLVVLLVLLLPSAALCLEIDASVSAALLASADPEGDSAINDVSAMSASFGCRAVLPPSTFSVTSMLPSDAAVSSDSVEAASDSERFRFSE